MAELTPPPYRAPIGMSQNRTPVYVTEAPWQRWFDGVYARQGAASAPTTNELDARLTTVEGQMAPLQTSMSTLQAEMTGLQNSMNALQSQMLTLQASQTTLQAQVLSLTDLAEDALSMAGGAL